MIWQLLSVFIDVIVPVFLLVGLGYWLGPKLKLQAQTLSRTAYYILTPAFTYTALSQAELQSGLVLRMIAFSALLGATLALLGLGIARLLRRPAGVAGALVMTAVFSNVGNLGLSLTEFRLGSAALLPATVYFLAIMAMGFVAGVGAASWASGRKVGGALLDVLKTPALLALLPAALVNSTGWQVPLLVTRATGLLSQATIPVMLLTLGVQLSGVARPRITLDVLVASGLRLLGGPLVAVALAAVTGLSGLARSAGILQASMPAAVLTSIIAIEYDVEPELVTTTVLFSTVLGVVTLTVLLALL